jgi:hypothetical protein
MEWFCSLETAFRLCGRQSGQNFNFGVISGKPVIFPQLAKTSRMTCQSVSMSGLAILHHSRIRLSSQGAFPEHFAPEYGNQIDGEGNGQDPESRPCRSDSS